MSPISPRFVLQSSGFKDITGEEILDSLDILQETSDVLDGGLKAFL